MMGNEAWRESKETATTNETTKEGETYTNPTERKDPSPPQPTADVWSHIKVK